MGDVLSEMRVVVAVMERGSFTAAATQFGITGSAAARLLTRVETRLGVKLMTRSTRRLKLTPEGEAFLPRGRRILADLDELEAEISSARTEPKGPLKIGCGNLFGLHHLIPVLPEFHDRYPHVQLELNVTDRRVDFVSAGLDVAIRHGSLDDSSLLALRLGEASRIICAAPRYIERCGIPNTPDDLRKHECLYSSSVPGLNLWSFRDASGVRTVQVSSRMSFDTSEGVFRAGVAGLGVIIVSEMIAGEAIRKGKLLPVLEDQHVREPVPIWLLTAPGRQRTARLSAFMEFLARKFATFSWQSSAEREVLMSDRAGS
jgi:DNA-binding transcriptional LysR family regulator